MLEAQRSQWGAERRWGGALPYFLLYDLCVLCALTVGWVVTYAWPRACGGERVWPLAAADGAPLVSYRLPSSELIGPLSGLELSLPALEWVGFVGCEGLDLSSPLLTASLYNLKMLYGLCCFPFLVFHVPLIGEALTKCRHTAYDQTGQLVVRLDKGDVATLYERRVTQEAKAGATEEKAAAARITPRGKPSPPPPTAAFAIEMPPAAAPAALDA